MQKKTIAQYLSVNPPWERTWKFFSGGKNLFFLDFHWKKIYAFVDHLKKNLTYIAGNYVSVCECQFS